MVYNLAVIYKKYWTINHDMMIFLADIFVPGWVSWVRQKKCMALQHLIWDEHPLTIWTVDTPNFRTQDPFKLFSIHKTMLHKIDIHTYIYIYEYLCIDKYAMICNIVPNSKIYPQKVETRRFTFRAIEQTVGTMGLLRMTRIAGSHGSRVDWWIVLFPKRWGGWRPGYWDGEKLWEKPMTLIRLGC